MPPNDWEFYVEGRIESKEPARIDPASQKWLQEMGLDQLVGPGAGTPTKSRAIRPPRRGISTKQGDAPR